MDGLDAPLRSAREGDGDAFAAIYLQLRTPVFRYLLAATRNRDEAEDMLADVFVEVASGIRRFEGTADAFVGWVFTIARNDVRDRQRRRARRTVEPTPDPPEPDAQPDPAEGVAARMDAFDALRALERLTTDQREVLLMRFVADRSLEEVAAALGKPIGAVKSLQHRALLALRRAVEERS